MKRVIIESPLAGATPEQVERNLRYARACLRDSLLRNEAPFASHVIYAQQGVLDDSVPAEREIGMEAGFAWGTCADLVVLYIDLGLSPGMIEGVKMAKARGILIEERTLRSFVLTDLGN